ncbi:hypothetical protein HPB48_013749 [Haemaphysalis longicornis]|uniref:Ubiquitin-conjugating enzyme E2 Z n=1 Tax=Haemaphysalis longicornis TaxID=44386 RepID=A0A9J6FZF2_HAELO|nr:hypothetical protein HPB48_013749 [Haemaphysalis longicornis]
MTYEYTLTGFGDFLEQRSITFVEPLPSVRVCSVCGVVPPATSMLPCCHAFCERCKSEMTRSIECPLDGQECTEASVVLLNFSLSELVQRRIRCPNSSRGCEFAGKLDELKQHLLKCSGKVVTCAKCRQRFARPDAMNHYRECTGDFGSTSAVSTVEHPSAIGVLTDIRKDLKHWRDGFAADGMKDGAGLRDVDSVIQRLERLETELVEGTKNGPRPTTRVPFSTCIKSSRFPVPYRAAFQAGALSPCIHALVIGPLDTPYEGGFFHFFIKCPTDYPIAPPRVRLLTTDSGRVRFNPNLYACGKVCLSILGTWSGPEWSAAQGLGSVLVSIQSLMNDKPYHNEPGFRKERRPGDAARYNSIIQHETVRVAVCDTVESCFLDDCILPPALMEKVLENFSDYYDCYQNNMRSQRQLHGTAMALYGQLLFHPSLHTMKGDSVNYEARQRREKEVYWAQCRPVLC